jgi:3-hydroxybutyryl-CoA dehydrogenase
VTQIAQATARPENVIGFHFFNPAPVQNFVELIFTQFSSSEVTSQALAIGRDLDKYVAQVSDQPGFIVNKLLLVYLNHAVQILDSGIATKQDIDAAMRDLAQYPMGPLELVDLIGIDTCVEILKTIHQDSGNDLHKPAAGLTHLLSKGNKGRKSGSGFYDYPTKHLPPTSENENLKVTIYTELETAYLGNAVAMEASGYASKADIDNGMKLGCGLPKGPFERIDQIGLESLRERQAALAASTGNPQFAPLSM